MNEKEWVKEVMVLGIDYEEFTPGSYRAVYLNDGTRFETGDPVADFQNAIQYCIDHPSVRRIIYSSSVDNFVCDDNGYLLLEDGELVANE